MVVACMFACMNKAEIVFCGSKEREQEGGMFFVVGKGERDVNIYSTL